MQNSYKFWYNRSQPTAEETAQLFWFNKGKQELGGQIHKDLNRLPN